MTSKDPRLSTESAGTAVLEHDVADQSGGTKGHEQEQPEGERGNQVEWTQEEERRIVRKLDFRVTGLLTLLFMLAFLDRSNIGNAETAGMGTDLKLSSSQYQWLLTIFYIFYILGQPCTLLWKLLPARIFVSCLTLCWGGFALLQASTNSWGGLMALRALLGVAETAYGPGVTYFLSFFYSRQELGLRQALYLGAAPIATAYAGALAYGITSIKGAAIADWRILFLIEGFPALVLVPVVYFTLPNSASTASFLSEREREIVVARAVKDGNKGHEAGLEWKNVMLGLKDYKAWIQALMYFSTNVSYSSLPVFLPTILTEMGFTSIRAQGLTAPPYLASFIVLVVCAFLSDRCGDRSAFIIPLSCIGGIGYVVLATCKTTAVRYFAVYLAACGIFPVVALSLPWVSNMHRDDSKRGAGFMLLNIVGQCGPLLGTRLYPKSEAPYYVKGMSVCAAFIFLVAALATLLRFILLAENRKLDREQAVQEQADKTEKGTEELVPFRYLL
ncbi:pantothenate transporter liz1 [Meredithblackwellia eburnea MCA 4105]